MPTAAKLVAALCFAFLGAVIGVLVDAQLPATQSTKYLYPVAIGCGAILGWWVSGAAKRSSMMEAASTGMRTAMLATLAALFTLALGTMLQTAMRGRYRDPTAAVLDIFNLFFEFGAFVLTAPILGTIFLGGVVAGMMTESAGRRWR